MAINQNHLFEELNGMKCAIVEKNVSGERVDFVRKILEYNGYTVVVAPSPPPKAAAVAPGVALPGASAGGTVGASAAGPGPADTTASAPVSAALPPAPETFSVGVTDVMFNPVNAVFGRLLKTPGGHVVTLAYWRQQENESNDEKPYFGGR
jgi:hypothetical protein